MTLPVLRVLTGACHVSGFHGSGAGDTGLVLMFDKDGDSARGPVFAHPPRSSTFVRMRFVTAASSVLSRPRKSTALVGDELVGEEEFIESDGVNAV